MSLIELRKKIDQLDEKIVALLNLRAQVSLEIGREKARTQKGVFAPDREIKVFKKIRSLNQGPMKDEGLEAIYREIMSGSLSLEKDVQIAYMGPQASFSHLAARRRFGSQVGYVACENISDVFHTVESGDCDYGVVPIENTIEGAVNHTFDLFVDSELKICSQILLDVSHNLLAKSGTSDIKRVYSNPMVFGQCRNWLVANLPHAELMEVVSTTRAAQMASKEENAACIASLMAAQIYDLRVLHKDIEDRPYNITRFLVIAQTDVPPTGHDRTSILFSIKDRMGALHDMLTPFYSNKINLTKIESRPSKRKAWDYYFFVDFEGHREDRHVKRALAGLEDMCKYLKILGSYPIA
ncbi:MAG TPA: prephenate dehydratase [Candidatus Omnitrophota bacterium]|nr:prephenate dehydratase [Candidatus Omnitrophota bacterium]HQO58555.1 prephenate dehydratase [Candidatus Omnitrophota bacterium]